MSTAIQSANPRVHQNGNEAGSFKRILVTREGYLTVAMSMLNDALFAPLDNPVPTNTRVACGWPSRGGLSKSRRVLGQAWHSKCSADGTYEILISPYLDEPLTVIAVLGHELVHVVVGFEHGHRGPFKRLATAIGLEGPMTATKPGVAFIEAVTPIVDALGTYPHAQLGIVGGLPVNPRAGPDDPDTTGPRPDRARMIKAQCPDCGMVIRLARKWISSSAPTCPNLECGHHDQLMEIG